MTTAEQLYPRALRRVQGAFIDGLVIPVAAICSLLVLTFFFGVEGGYIKATVAASVIFALEPGAVSLTGGTIGHHIVGMRVRRVATDQNLSFLAAILRFLAKTFLGLPAFLVIFTTKKRQALHDLLARSIIVYRNGASIPAHETLPELDRAEESRAYASVWRRILVIAVYWFAAYMLWSIPATMICGLESECPEEAEPTMLVIVIALLLSLVVLTILGWKGRLYGARRQHAA